VSVRDETDRLRALVEERVDQVQIGSGEDELAAAIIGVLDLIDTAERVKGDRSLSTGALRDAIREGLA